MDEKEILQAIKDDTLYDFITRKYYSMSKEQLRDLILELYYMARYDYVMSIDTEENKLNNYIIECLKENREWEE